MKTTLRTPHAHVSHRFAVLIGALLVCLTAGCQETKINRLLAPAPVPAHSELLTLHLTVPVEHLELMASAIDRGDPKLGSEPGGDRPYVDALYMNEHGVKHSVRIRYRGLSRWHHQRMKPSLRIVIPKDQVVSGARRIDLQRPEDVLAIRNILPNEMGRQLGLLTVPYEPVRLFVNGEYLGVYVRSPRPDSSSVALAGRMAGTLFKGDNGDASLWTGAAPWKQRGETPESVKFFEALLSQTAQVPSAESISRFFSYIDRPSSLRWAVLGILTGSLHTDAWHNHLVHVALERGKAEFMPWDMNGFGTHAEPNVPPDVVHHPFIKMMLSDPRWVHDRNLLLHALLEGELSPDLQKQLARELVDRMLPDLEADPYLASLENRGPAQAALIRFDRSEIPRARQTLELWIDRRAEALRTYLDDAKVHVRAFGQGSRVSVFGRVAVRVQVPGRPEDAVLYPGLSMATVPFENRLPYGTYTVDVATPTPLDYDLPVRPDQLTFVNAITGKPVAVSATAATSAPPRHSALARDFPPEPTADVVLGPGTVRVEQDVRVGSKQRLIVRAGTRLRMGPGVSILSFGVTLVEGTASAPVVIEPAGKAPWGTFGVSGEATRGSRFEHMAISGGAAASDGQVHFKGMFNIYECPDAVIQQCFFGANAAGDDAVNLAFSRVTVADSRWEGARADALDIDGGRGLIERCSFSGSGNDGLDLMSSVLVVRNIVTRSNGDKGISVGEGTDLLVIESTIADNGVGVEVKDESRLWIDNSRIVGNGQGLRSYKKKWSYVDAGTSLLSNTQVERSTTASVNLEATARLLSLRCPVPESSQVQVVTGVPREWTAWRDGAVTLSARPPSLRSSRVTFAPGGDAEPSRVARRERHHRAPPD